MDREELCVGLRTLGADVPDEQCGWLFDQVPRRPSDEVWLRRIFARTFNLKLRREPRRVGDQVLRVKVLDFDRLSSDDPLGTLEIDVFEVT